MPYLETSQAFLEQSSLLLEAYPESTRITTRYSYPSRLRLSKARSKKPRKAADTSDNPASAEPATTIPIASLTLKTYNPSTGICLKYRTDKAAEVGRLISGLGKLASGAKILSDPGTTVAPSGGTAGEIDRADTPAAAGESGSAAIATATATTPAPAPGPLAAGKAETGGKGGKSKKKGGKGKR